MPNNHNKGNSTSIVLDFVDPLFAVVISISFIGVMTKPWFTQYPSEWQASYVFNIVTLFLGYSTVVLSWVGYHRSIRSKPIKLDTMPGFWRFVFDIVLLFLYWLILVKFENFWLVLMLLAIIYGVFVIWDVFKWREYKDVMELESHRRRGVSTLWAILFAALFMIYWRVSCADELPNVKDWSFLALAYVATISYRLNKEHFRSRVWNVCLDLLSFRLPKKDK